MGVDSVCLRCRHPRAHHTTGGMCDAGDCFCVGFESQVDGRGFPVDPPRWHYLTEREKQILRDEREGEFFHPCAECGSPSLCEWGRDCAHGISRDELREQRTFVTVDAPDGPFGPVVRDV